MKLKEHEGKAIFRRYGIPTNDGYTLNGVSDIRPIARPMVVKAQIRSGGRGRAGGIRFASTNEQAERAVRELLDMEIGGEKVEEVLIEERVNIAREFYASIFLDRGTRLPRLMMAREGGVDVESVDPALIMSWTISPLTGVPEYLHREAASELMLDPRPATQLAAIIDRLFQLFWQMDCELVEVNPLVMDQEGQMIAIDAKVVLDDDALFRHPEYSGHIDPRGGLEALAKEKGISLVQLEGDVGVIANGAGLTMATLDMLALHGAKGGVFLDLAGTDEERVVEDALKMVHKAKPRVTLVNIFGGITKCDTVAKGIIQAMNELGTDMGLVVRLRGVNDEKARAMLQEKGIAALKDLDEACAKAASWKVD